MRIALLSIVLMLIAINLSFAQADFQYKFSPTSASIPVNATATFDLKIWHGQPEAISFEIFSLDVRWSIRSEFPLLVAPDKIFTTKIHLTPLKLNPGVYGVPISIGYKGNYRKEILIIELLGPEAFLGYKPAIKGNFSLKYSNDPRQALKVEIYLRNLNLKNITNSTLKLRSNLINQNLDLAIKPLQEKQFDLEFKLDPKTPPQKDDLRIKLEVFVEEENRTYEFDFGQKEFEIISYGEISERFEKTGKFLIRQKIWEFENLANIELKKTLEEKTWFLKNLFSSFSPEPKKMKNKLIWEIVLAPGEKAKVEIKTYYHAIPLIFILVFGTFLAFYFSRSPLVINKSIEIVSKKDEFAELNVKINLRNRSSSKLSNVKFIDIVPILADFVAVEEVGALPVSKVTKGTRKGTIIKWETEMEAKEEKFAIYKMRTKLGLIGKITFPAPIAKFSLPSGAEREIVGKSVEVGF